MASLIVISTRLNTHAKASKYMYFAEADPIYRFAFTQWVKWLDAGKIQHLGVIGMVMVRGHERNATKITQKAWLTDIDNKIIVKNVLKLGSEPYSQVATCHGLQQSLCKNGVPASQACAGNINDAVKVTKSTSHGTRDHYYDAESCAIIAKWFEEDFTEFNYNISACP